MNLDQLTDTQLANRLDALAEVFLASCELDHDLPMLENELDCHYHEANRRGML